MSDEGKMEFSEAGDAAKVAIKGAEERAKADAEECFRLRLSLEEAERRLKRWNILLEGLTIALSGIEQES